MHRGSSTWGASDDDEMDERPKPQKQASPMRQPSSVFEDNHAKLKSKGAYGAAVCPADASPSARKRGCESECLLISNNLGKV